MSKKLVILVVVFLILVTACAKIDSVQPPEGQQELQLLLWGDERGSIVTLTHSGGTISAWAESVHWYYDVKDNLREYAVVYKTGDHYDLYLHLLESRQPVKSD